MNSDDTRVATNRKRHNVKIIRWGLLCCAVGVLLFALGIWRPQWRVRRVLELGAAIQVNGTTIDELRQMATRFGVPLTEGKNGFFVEERNSLMEHLHLAPQTYLHLNIGVERGVVSDLSIRAWIGSEAQFADIDIREFETFNTGCGAVPVCVRPSTSTMLTSVFFAPSTPVTERHRLLSLDASCFARLAGCKSSREFYPAAWDGKYAHLDDPH